MLGVKRSSLYSYVSRGLLRAQRMPQHKGSSYLLSDVARLARQRAVIRNPAKLAQSALDWGQAILPSAITQVLNGTFFYRGHNAVELAEHASLEEVAALLWQNDVEGLAQTGCPQSQASTQPHAALPGTGEALSRWFQSPTSLTTVTPEATAQPMQLVRAMCAALLGRTITDTTIADATPIHQVLQSQWRITPAAADLLRRALVLCADHELNASTFAVRVVVSTGASLHAGLGAGLAALSGPKHGGMTTLINSHWDDWHDHMPRRDAGAPLASGLDKLLRETQSSSTPNYCTGFGHPLYPQGDPRSRALLAALPQSPAVQQLTAAVFAKTGLHPSLDYALVALQRGLSLPPGAAFVLFALGRSVGWIAHAREQAESGQLIRPRAVYPRDGEQALANQLEANDKGRGRVVRFR